MIPNICSIHNKTHIMPNPIDTNTAMLIQNIVVHPCKFRRHDSMRRCKTDTHIELRQTTRLVIPDDTDVANTQTRMS